MTSEMTGCSGFGDERGGECDYVAVATETGADVGADFTRKL